MGERHGRRHCARSWRVAPRRWPSVSHGAKRGFSGGDQEPAEEGIDVAAIAGEEGADLSCYMAILAEGEGGYSAQDGYFVLMQNDARIYGMRGPRVASLMSA